MRKFSALLLPLVLFPACAYADDYDFGVDAIFSVDKSLVQNLSLQVETEVRTNEDSERFERFSLGAALSYKPISFLSLSVGYNFLYDFADKNITTDNGRTFAERYWYDRHRVHAAVTATLKLGGFSASLRERYQYTYTPEEDVNRLEAGAPKKYTHKAKDKHSARTRLELSYSIAASGIAPYVSAELYHWDSLQKSKFIGGVKWNVTSSHTASIFYAYQWILAENDASPDMHYLGVSYKFKF